MRNKLSVISLLIVLLFAGIAGSTGCGPQQTTQTPGYPYYPRDHMRGPGGMMGPGGPYGAGGQRISMEQAIEIVENYLSARSDSDLEAEEIMEFSYNFYVEFSEKSTGIQAFEALIDPYTGDMYPEPGPNMIWNTKYGMMSGMMWGTPSISTPMTVTGEEAVKYAQEFLDSYLPGAKAEEAEEFYGYYTLHVVNDGQIYGMLSVNGYTGQVWYHFWHGQFMGMKEFEKFEEY